MSFSRTETIYDGGEQIFTIPFPYIKEEHIDVFINDIPTQNFEFLNATQILVNDILVIGDRVLRERNTPIEKKMVIYTDTSMLKKENLNLAQDQLIFAVQENLDANEEFKEIADTVTESLVEINQQVIRATAQADRAEDISNSFDDNAQNLTNTFNQNATDKQEQIDTSAQNAFEQAERAASEAQNAEAEKIRASEYANLIWNNTQALQKDFIKLTSDRQALILKGGTFIRCTLSGKIYNFKNLDDLVFDFKEKLDIPETTLTAGTNYSIFLVESTVTESGLDFVVSKNAVAPDGYTTDNSYRIGGFHTQILNITSTNVPVQLDGTTHPYLNHNVGDIVPHSIWTLLHQPVSSPAGMVYIEKFKIWVDIYLQSGKDGNQSSVYNATVADSRQPIRHMWDMVLQGKRLPIDFEFAEFAEGSPQQVAIVGAAAPNPKTAGGHLTTSGKAMISKYGVWECCGYLWQWLSDMGVNGGTGWVSYGSGNDTRGQSYGMPNVMLAGGSWSSSSDCGSWSRHCNHGRALVFAHCGGRGVSQNLFG